MRNKDKRLNIVMREKRLFISIGIRNSPILGTLLHAIGKASSTKLIHPIDIAGSTALPNVNLSPKNRNIS